MNKLEKLVPSLELMERLQQLGAMFPLTNFYWTTPTKKLVFTESTAVSKIAFRSGPDIPAPTAEELLQVLPNFYQVRKIIMGNVYNDEGPVTVYLATNATNNKTEEEWGHSVADTPANALAGALIMALESGKLMAEDLFRKEVQHG